MWKTETIVDTVLLTVGSAYSLTFIESILGIIILLINMLWISVKLIDKIVRVIKNKQNLDSLDDDINEYIDSIEDIKDYFDSDEEAKDEQDSEQK